MPNIAWGKKLKADEKAAIIQIATNLGIKADWLMSCMAFESGETFDPAIKNAAGSPACVDSLTELLTVRGWKTWDRLSVGDEILSFNLATDKIERDTINNLITKTSNDNYHITCRSFDAFTTHDHTWYLRKKYYNRVHVSEETVKKTTEELVVQKSPYLYSFLHPHKSYNMSSKKVTRYRKYLLVLLGMICGDGSINKKRGHIELVQSVKATPKRCKTVKHILSVIFPEGVSTDLRKSKEMLRWNFNAQQSKLLMPYFDREWNAHNKGSRFIKKLNPSLLAELSPNEANSLLCGYLFTDGNFCKTNKKISFKNTEKTIIDDFMHVAVLCGKNPRMTVTLREGKTHIFPGGREYPIKDIYTVNLRRFKYTSANKKQLTIEHNTNSEFMWCPSTTNGTWIARRGGTVYITGNCGLIQFMEVTAIGLGTTTEKLSKMTLLEQLKYVEKYFQPYKNKMKNLGDVYMCILWPSGCGKADDYVLFSKNDTKYPKRYIQNKGLDFNKDGLITRGECCTKVQVKLDKGLSSEFFG